jgi:hypothetical protein
MVGAKQKQHTCGNTTYMSHKYYGYVDTVFYLCRTLNSDIAIRLYTCQSPKSISSLYYNIKSIYIHFYARTNSYTFVCTLHFCAKYVQLISRKL